MSNNAQWKVEGRDQNGGFVGLYLASPDLRNAREAKRRAALTAKERWKKKGVKAVVTAICCVG